jgi:cation:H+ antiporter
MESTEMLFPTLLLLLGTVFLYLGAEGLVRGSASLAFRAGIGSLVVGLTVVAYGTSCPK